MPQAPRPANLGPRHNWCRYLSFVALFLMAHIVAHFSFGGMSSGWNILSAGAFGLALGVPIGQAECCPVLCTILALCVCIERCLSDSPHAGTTAMDTRLCSSYVLPSLAASACCWVPSPFGFRGPGFLKCSHKVTSTPRRGANEAMRTKARKVPRIVCRYSFSLSQHGKNQIHHQEVALSGCLQPRVSS